MTFIDSHESLPSGGDPRLSALLASWEAPPVPAALDRRIFESFQQRFGTESLLPNGALAQSPMIFEVNHMKTCEACNEEFSDQFAFCPLDGAPLIAQIDQSAAEPNFVFTEVTAESGFAAPGTGAYHLTLLDDVGLVARLTAEMRAAAHESRLTWPEFRRDPFGFAGRSLAAYAGMVRRGLGNPNVGLALATSCALVIAVIAAMFIFDQYHARKAALLAQNENLTLEQMVDIPDVQPKADPGAAGRDKGNGGGSKAQQEKPSGGGGGGRQEETPASQGKLAPASLTTPIIVPPNPKPPPPTKDPLLVPPVLDADPTLFPTDTTSRNFGDPNSKTTATSSGPGSGGGIGNGSGGGVGTGNDGGFGPGNGGNTGNGDRNIGGGGKGGGGGLDYTKVFKGTEVNQKARIISKPTPEYTEEARVNNVTGTVRIMAVFSASGQVLNVRALNQLPNGLTERAINAARRIQFTPAMKDGRAVSSYVEIEYNFNIY